MGGATPNALTCATAVIGGAFGVGVIRGLKTVTTTPSRVATLFRTPRLTLGRNVTLLKCSHTPDYYAHNKSLNTHIYISKCGDMEMSKKKKAVKRESVAPGVVPGIVKTSIGLSYELWRCAKITALETGITLAELVESALRKFLDKEKGREG